MQSSGNEFPSTHASLLCRLKDGTDRAAWSEFQARYRELLLRFCRRRGLQPADAEDVVQNVLLSLSRAMPGFTYDPSKGRFRDYLFRCIRNGIARWAACPKGEPARLVHTEGELWPDVEDRQATAAEAEAWEQEWAAHHYRRALARLSSDGDDTMYQLLQRSIEGASVADLSAQFGMTTDAVYKARQRARDRVQSMVAEQIREEDESFVTLRS